MIVFVVGLVLGFGALLLGYLEVGAALGDTAQAPFDKCYFCMRSLSLTSGGEGWAVGEDGTYLLHFHDGTQAWVKSPGYAFLVGVTMLSSSEGWAYGDSILHYHDGQWQFVRALPNGVILDGMSFTSPNDGWAAGSTEDGNLTSSLLMHYTGGTWTTLPQTAGIALNSVAMVSPDEGWAVGERWQGNTVLGGVILHYAGGVWAEVPPPVDLPFSKVAMRSADDGWIVAGESGTEGAFLQYVNGAWRVTASVEGLGLRDVALYGGDGGAVIGWLGSIDSPRAAVLFVLRGGIWQAETLPRAGFLDAVAASDDGTVRAVGDVPFAYEAGARRGILVTRGGETWAVQDIPRIPAEDAPHLLLPALLPFSIITDGLLCVAIIVVVLVLLRKLPDEVGRWTRLSFVLAGLLFLAMAVTIEIGQIDALRDPDPYSDFARNVGTVLVFLPLGGVVLQVASAVGRLVQTVRSVKTLPKLLEEQIQKALRDAQRQPSEGHDSRRDGM